MVKDKVDAETWKYMENRKTAKWIGKYLFMGATLHSFQPDWKFMYPEYMSKGVFTIPDYIMGLIAERIGKTWTWNERNRHPLDIIKQRLQNEKETEERWKEMTQELMKMVNESQVGNTNDKKE